MGGGLLHSSFEISSMLSYAVADGNLEVSFKILCGERRAGVRQQGTFAVCNCATAEDDLL